MFKKISKDDKYDTDEWSELQLELTKEQAKEVEDFLFLFELINMIKNYGNVKSK